MDAKRFNQIMRDVGARQVEEDDDQETESVSESASSEYIRVRISEGVTLLVPGRPGPRSEAEKLADFNRVMREVGLRPVRA